MSFLYTVPSLIHHVIFNPASAGPGHPWTFTGKTPAGRDIKEDFNLDLLTVKSLPASLKGNHCVHFSLLFIPRVSFYLSIFYTLLFFP